MAFDGGMELDAKVMVGIGGDTRRYRGDEVLGIGLGVEG